MANFSRHTLNAVLLCCAVSSATAAPTVRILYHEAIRPETQQVSGHTRSMSFEAYGRRFNVNLKSNIAVGHAVPAGRSDIEPLLGQLEGEPHSWVRLTHTRTGWHGLIVDGQELYAIEPVSSVGESLVQPVADASETATVMYRLKDALLPSGPALCEILNPDGTPYTGSADSLSASSGSPSVQVTEKRLFDSVVRDATTRAAATNSSGPHLQLKWGIVADYEFYQAFNTDPEGAIIARVNIVDGIWSDQVGVKISLAPLTVLKTPAEPFTKTDPTALLSQLRTYRGTHSDQMAIGATHLMTGRDLDGDIVGISYMNSVCNGDTADSLSEGAHSTLMSGLIAAHELGHNFNAPHDGEAGACSSTPQTYLMAPKINYSSQFSACSLQQISARIQTASCLAPYHSPDVAVELPATAVGAVAGSAFTLSFVAHAIGDDVSNDVSAIATLPTGMSVQSATSTGGGTCTSDSGSVTCTLGKLSPNESRQIDLTVVSSTVGSSTVTVSVASSNDSVVTNNSAQVAIQISPEPPSTAPVTSASSGAGSSGGGGGGGGGSMDWAIVAALGASAGIAMRRRLRATVAFGIGFDGRR